MAGKRTATSELNHENWDQDDEPEEAGEFKKASEDVLKRRVIKTARRRNPISSGDESSGKGVFGGFSGFATKAPSTSTAFSFLNNVTKEKDTSTPVNGTSMFGGPKTSGSTPLETNNDYFAKLKGLNESVSTWIKNKVDANPFINLQPIFKDYEKYFETLEKEKSATGNGTKGMDDTAFKSQLSSFVFKSTEQKPVDAPTPAVTPQFSFGSSSKSDGAEASKPMFGSTSVENKTAALFSFAKKDEEVQKKPMFGYGSKESSEEFPKFGFGSTSTTATKPTFSFGSTAGTNTSSSGLTGSTSSTSTFSFSGSKPFSFGNVATIATTAPTADADNKEEDDEPPKNEYTPVVEEGHVYTTRCKVFVKAAGNFGDRGVGTLYLKPVPDSEKTQLIVRADTSLGNLLCNFILSMSIPTKRIGKKDVMLVCLPTPETKPPPVPVLLRVKSPEEADELLTELEKYKK